MYFFNVYLQYVLKFTGFELTNIKYWATNHLMCGFMIIKHIRCMRK